MIKNYLKKILSISNIRRLGNLVNGIQAVGSGNNLNKLGSIYGTDKVGDHFYTSHYMTHLKRFKYKKINLLEIGVGGYESPDVGGESLRMWKKYFPFGKIFSLDIHDKSSLQENRIKIFKGSQIDIEFLNHVTTVTGDLDIIIDDGSHINEHVIETFKVLFPKLKDGGVYVIEDTQTSYWEEYGGDSENLNNPKTMTNFFKSLTDSLNNQEFNIKNYEQTYYDKKIISIHFYHNLIFIYKGNNDEKSNLVIDNQI
jgi:demethylmacrocin O-methyltransferase